jgi:hypothetical protein
MIKELCQARLGITILGFVFLTCSQASAQQNKPKAAVKTDLVEILVKVLNISQKPRKTDGKKKVAFSIIPITTSKSGGKQVFVSSINAAFLLSQDEKTNYSSVFFLPYTDFSQNIGFGLKYNLFTPKNSWNLPGELRISNLTEYSYGLGSGSTESDRFRLNYNNLRFNFIANRKLQGYIFGGVGLSYDRFFSVGVSEAPNSPGEFEKYGIGVGSASSATGIIFNLLHDNRKNSINPADGLYIQTILRLNPSWLANDNLWSSVYIDGRRYFRLDDPKRKIIAVSAFYWGTYGDVPYFNLTGTQLEFGGRSGRGYSVARFRGRHMIYMEGEYRFDISRNGLFGGVGFINFQSITDNKNRIGAIDPAIGAGARIKFNKSSDTNLAIDFGFGINSFGIYIGLGEFY